MFTFFRYFCKSLYPSYKFVRYEWLPIVYFFWCERQYYLSIYLFFLVIWIAIVVIAVFTVGIPVLISTFIERTDFSFPKRWF